MYLRLEMYIDSYYFEIYFTGPCLRSVYLFKTVFKTKKLCHFLGTTRVLGIDRNLRILFGAVIIASKFLNMQFFRCIRLGLLRGTAEAAAKKCNTPYSAGRRAFFRGRRIVSCAALSRHEGG